MVFMVLNLGVEDYPEWKRVFDSDPAGRRESATGYVLSRNVDDPNDVFIRVEFESVETAVAFRERLLASGALTAAIVKTGPTVIESVENVTY
jgi:hypothetical protein